MASIPSNGYAEVMSGTNNYSGSNSFDGSCPRTAIAPVINNDITNKIYVDGRTSVVGSTTTSGLVLTGDAALLSGTSGGNSGQHLVVVVNGATYKIKLENP